MASLFLFNASVLPTTNVIPRGSNDFVSILACQDYMGSLYDQNLLLKICSVVLVLLMFAYFAYEHYQNKKKSDKT